MARAGLSRDLREGRKAPHLLVRRGRRRGGGNLWSIRNTNVHFQDEEVLMLDADVALTLIRVVLGVTFLAHGWNHGWGGGGLAGTARWFESIGLRPARVHATMSVGVEIAAGASLILGLLLPLAVAATVGTMGVAAWTVHRKHGFFIFREGYEYVLVLASALISLGILGPGRFSLDHALGFDLSGLAWGLGAATLGLAGTIVLLAMCWRPNRSAP